MKFGWCSDGHHENCRAVFREHWKDDVIRRCECECHAGKEIPDPPPSKKSLSQPEDTGQSPRRRKKK